MGVDIIYALKGRQRRELAQAISEAMNTVPRYRGVPSCVYEIGGCVLDREGTLHIGDDVDAEAAKNLLTYLAGQGYVAQSSEAAGINGSGLVISVPKKNLSEAALQNLLRLAKSKGGLMGKALGKNLPAPIIGKDKVSFPWFPDSPEPEEVNAYTQFVDKLCEMARTQKRVSAHVMESDNEKYTFRCFLLRLGFIGDEYKTDRKILMRYLPGNSAFKGGEGHAISK